MAIEIPQTLEYMGDQLNVAPLLEVENFTNWKKMFIYHIIGIEPQFENIIKNGPYIPVVVGQRKPEVQWLTGERKAANLDQRLKSLIMFVLPDDQMNSVMNCLTTKSIWDDLILYHEGPFDVKESKDFQDSPDDEEDTRISQEYLNDLEVEYQTRALLAKSKRFFKKGSQTFSIPSFPLPNQNHTQPRRSSSSLHKNKGLIDDNEVMEVKALMALAKEERVSVSKECARNGEWVQISIRKVHTLLKLEDNDERKSVLDYLCIDLNYVEDQRNNLLSKHRDLAQTLNTCKEQLLCISEQIPYQKKRILGVGQLTEDPSSSGLKDLVFIKSSVNNTKASILGVERPWLSEAKVAVIDSSETEYDSAEESSVCSIFFLPLEKPSDAKTVSGPKAVKTTLKSISTFNAEDLKGIIPNELSSAPAQENKKASALKTNSAPTENSKNVKSTDYLYLAIVIKELNDLKLQVSKNQSSQSKDKQVSQNTLQNKKKPNSKGVVNFVD
ncbi:hypothetical protein Tco_0250774 [Tanacetum coccineum]